MANNDKMLKIIELLKHDLLSTELERLMKIGEEIEILQIISKKIGELKEIYKITPPIIRKGAEQKVISEIEKLESKIEKLESKIKESNLKVITESGEKVSKKSMFLRLKELNSKIEKLKSMIEKLDLKIKELDLRRSTIIMGAFLRGDLRKVYDAEAEKNEIEDIIINIINDTECYTLGNSDTKTASALTVIFDFFKKRPQQQGELQKLYNITVKHLLHQIQNGGEVAKTTLHHMASTLGEGRCPTPVADFLLQTATTLINDNKLEGYTPEYLDALIAKVALQEKAQELINKSPYKNETEVVEILQALVNSVFLKGAEDYTGAIKIAGKRPFYLPSQTQNIEFAFLQLKNRKDLTVPFAKLCCKTNKRGKLVIKRGKPFFWRTKYVLDDSKIKALKQAYYTKRGILSVEEQYVNKFKNQFNTLVQREAYSYLLLDHTDKEDVKEKLDTYTLTTALREKLNTPNGKKLEEITEEHLNQVKKDLNQLTQTYPSEKKKQLTHFKTEFAAFLKEKKCSYLLNCEKKLYDNKAREEGKKIQSETVTLENWFIAKLDSILEQSEETSEFKKRTTHSLAQAKAMLPELLKQYPPQHTMQGEVDLSTLTQTTNSAPTKCKRSKARKEQATRPRLSF